ncbi:11540_t:CDS:2, partial [Funneliformis geosporum]
MSEEEIKDFIKSSVNWTEMKKWIAEGMPYEEHDEVLMFLNQEKKRAGQYKADGKRKQTNGKISNQSARKTDKKARKESHINSATKGTKTPSVTTVNIVVKFLDQDKFPILSGYTTQMLQDLNNDGLINDVIGLNIKGKIREFNQNQTSIKPAVRTYDIVPKCSYMYALLLPNNHYLMLRHLC